MAGRAASGIPAGRATQDGPTASPGVQVDPGVPAGPPVQVDPGVLARCTFPPPGSPLVCGVSGGADSLALLVLAAAAGCRVTAIHVDHGLRPGSADEADVVADAARRAGAAFRSVSARVPPGPNLEERARAARWAALGSDAATGHTMDDQAETVLINLLRGAGADGLAGMRPGARHPLLALRRSDTRAVCVSAGLRPLADPSNDDPRFVRNRVRHELLPLCSALARRDVVPLLCRQAGVLADESSFLDALAGQLDVLDGRVLAEAPRPLARRAVRGWLRSDDAHPPGLAAVDRVLAVARGDARAAEVGGGRQVRRSGGRLRLVRAAVADATVG